MTHAPRSKPEPADPYWWLSYAGEEGFRGGVLIQAPDFLSACLLSKQLGLSPGGQVCGDEMPAERAKEMMAETGIRERVLLRKEDIPEPVDYEGNPA